MKKVIFIVSFIFFNSLTLASIDLEKANNLFNDVAAGQSDYGCFKGNSVSKCLDELKRSRSNSKLSGAGNDQAILEHIFSLLKSQRRTSDFELVINSGAVGFTKEKHNEFFEMLYNNYLTHAKNSGNARYWVKAFNIKPSEKLAKKFANDASPDDLLWANNNKISTNKELKKSVIKRINENPDFSYKIFTAYEEALSKGVKIHSNPSDDFLITAYRSYAKQHDSSDKYLLKAYNISKSQEDLISLISIIDNKSAYKLSQNKLKENNEFKILLENKLRIRQSEDSLYYLAKLTLRREDIIASLEKTIKTKNTIKKNELFTYLLNKTKNINQVKQFFTLLRKCSDCNKEDHYKNAQRVAGFGKDLTEDNFLKSIEYNYVLKNITPKINPIRKKRMYGFTANYGYFSMDFTQPGDCQFSHSISEEGLKGLIFSKRVVRDYDIYKCYSKNESNKMLIKLSNIDISHINDIKEINWDYYIHTNTTYLANNKGNNRYFSAADQKDICLAATNRKNKYSCYQIKDEEIHNMCIGISERPVSCYSIKNQDLQNFCLAASGQFRNACYQIKDSELKEACIGVSHYSNNCYNVKDANLQLMCLGISKDETFCYSIK